MAKEEDNEKRRCTEERERGTLGERMWVSEREYVEAEEEWVVEGRKDDEAKTVKGDELHFSKQKLVLHNKSLLKYEAHINTNKNSK